MKLKEVNASSRKTIELIKKKFAELIEEKKEINNITVTELVKKANITRGTFYAHYSNIYEVAKEFQDEILKEILDTEYQITNQKEMNEAFNHIFNFLTEHETLYFKLLAADDAMLFMNRLNKKICSSLTTILNNKNKELDILFFTNGTISLIVKYFRKEINYSLKDICDYTKKMANYLFFQEKN